MDVRIFYLFPTLETIVNHCVTIVPDRPSNCILMAEDHVLLSHCIVRPRAFYGYIPEQLSNVFADSSVRVCGYFFISLQN